MYIVCVCTVIPKNLDTAVTVVLMAAWFVVLRLQSTFSRALLPLLSPDIVFIGPVGSGKSSLIGSLYRAVNEEDRFPERIQLTLNHPDDDSHGTMHWMETQGNRRGTIVYQDTRGDQVGLWGLRGGWGTQGGPLCTRTPEETRLGMGVRGRVQ